GSGVSGAAARAISVALAQTGKPYVFGSEGPNSFDCSGLMQYAAAAAGVRIPRIANDQYRQLPKVNPSQIRPGDLIFPESSFENGVAGHVIMYIGNGRCIAASRTGVPIGQVPLPRSYRATRWT
ncbi:NlpC/P60 family protein, partial [Nocardia sp. NPDC049190]|uniref:C40 family peptidase n=1 Tax=Nocardia sp. NPDC049190 TaxID=3155650 RepID=UPI0033D3BA99